jgi:hypothetical protein
MPQLISRRTIAAGMRNVGWRRSDGLGLLPRITGDQEIMRNLLVSKDRKTK